MLRQSGVSLIELLIGLAVLGLMIAIGMPSLATWMQNTQVRSAAESILQGLQVARAEAIRKNTQAIFKLTSSSGVPDWSVLADDPTIAGISLTVAVQSWSGVQEKNARVGVELSTATTATPYSTAITSGTGLPASVTFDNFGKMVNAGISRIDVTNSADSSARRLVIIITPFGQVKMCDPALSLASNPEGCA